MSFIAITEHAKEMQSISTSTSTISTINNEIIDTIKAWKHRVLNYHYPGVWLDAIHYKVKD